MELRSYHQEIRDQKPFYEAHPWKIIERGFSPEQNHHSETIFALGNGYQGVRGHLEEGFSSSEGETTPGVYINGIYYSKDYTYEERVPLEPLFGQTLLHLTDWTPIIPAVKGEELSFSSSTVESFHRSLCLREGALTRRTRWKTSAGLILDIECSRLVSLKSRHISLIRYAITPVNFSGWVSLSSLLKGDVSNSHSLRGERALILQEKIFSKEGQQLALTQEIAKPSTLVSCAMHNQLEHSNRFEVERLDDKTTGYCYHLYLSKGETAVLNKYIYLISSLEVLEGRDITRAAIEGANSAAKRGHKRLLAQQREYLDSFWERSDVQIEGDLAIQQGLRYNLFSLLQSTGKDGKRSVAAKGLSGEFYEGHYFWDTEIYIHPFFLFTHPTIARDLLSYRYKILDSSRENAQRFKNMGALYSWRTINGQEASAYFMGSSVQCHINAAIAYAIKNYHQITGDDTFLIEMGAEILFETARFWRDRGFFSSENSQFEIHVVCGPDEYKPGVNNNCYTNYMAAFNIEYAIEVANFLRKSYGQEYMELTGRIGLTEEEIATWRDALESMRFPFDRERGIHPQDDSFQQKEPLDVDSLTWEDVPLVSKWHPLRIWRYQVIKQADVILLLFLLGDKFSLEEKRADFDYYEPRTTHDSSLSPAIYSIIAAEIGYLDYSFEYFRQTVRLDLDNYNGNTWQGLHMAALGSSWMVVVYGYAGLRLRHNALSFNPIMPKDLSLYRFKLQFKGQLLEVEVGEKGRTTYSLKTEGPLDIYHRGDLLHLV